MFLLSTLTVKAWASEGIKNCYQAFECKNSSQSSTSHVLQKHQLGKGIKQFDQELDRASETGQAHICTQDTIMMQLSAV